ncbi:LuxR C-terminal-related transcriptional regulator [Gordonia sp. w5E2]|uniref:LuxR C-terminal-related transcriptional regulator n=1 Tax=Gordonia TaxID=2053 RepID=UPI0009C9DC44|nr:LuxR C-terminal-related transcriptional regulator [Gordonia jacobaea]SKY09885.1 response regulator containing a CheY-like receiver domain and an HTH DNA-binding domain [Mycobacteroides abscessus subsp. abscessus]
MAESLTAPVTDALRRLRRGTGVSLAFGGVVHGSRGLRLRHFVGDTYGALNGVAVDAGHGLGGKVMALNRPMVVDDYLRTPRITHRYNAIIAAEGLRAVAAAPVIVERRPVAVIYGALRTDEAIGDRTLDALAVEARELEQQIVASRATVAADAAAGDGLRDRITEAYAQLRTLARDVDDVAVADQIARISDLLLDGESDEPTTLSLTRREQDVVTLAALGYTNARIAEQLNIGVQTAKGYMKDILRKLGASSRLEAVVIARRSGLLP